MDIEFQWKKSMKGKNKMKKKGVMGEEGEKINIHLSMCVRKSMYSLTDSSMCMSLYGLVMEWEQASVCFCFSQRKFTILPWKSKFVQFRCLKLNFNQNGSPFASDQKRRSMGNLPTDDVRIIDVFEALTIITKLLMLSYIIIIKKNLTNLYCKVFSIRRSRMVLDPSDNKSIGFLPCSGWKNLENNIQHKNFTKLKVRKIIWCVSHSTFS